MKITSRFSLHCSFYPQLKVGIEEFKLEARTLSMLSNFLMQYLPLECTTFHAKELWCTLTHKNSGSNWEYLPSVTVNDLRIEILVTSQKDWDIEHGISMTTLVKHNFANYLTSIIEDSVSVAPVGYFKALIDTAIRDMCVRISNFTLRFEYKEGEEHSMGVCCSSLSLESKVADVDGTLNSSVHDNLTNVYDIRVEGLSIYVDPSLNKLGPHEYFLQAQEAKGELNIPSLFSVMFQPGRRPNGALKRAKLNVICRGVNISLHEWQTSSLIYSCTKAFGGVGDGYRRWRDVLAEEIERRCVNYVLTCEERSRYLTLYCSLRKPSPWWMGWMQDSARIVRMKLLDIERKMTVSAIMSCRRVAMGWSFSYEDTCKDERFTGTVNYLNSISHECEGRNELLYTPAEWHPLQRLEYNEGDEDAHDRLMAQCIEIKRPYYDDICAVLRDVQLDLRRIEDLTINVYEDTGEGCANRPLTGGTLVGSLFAEMAHFSSTLMLCRNPNYPYGSIGATDGMNEPSYAWFQCDSGMLNFRICWNPVPSTQEENSGSSSTCVITETKAGINGKRTEKYQATVYFSRESNKSMTLHLGFRDSVVNAFLLRETFQLLAVLRRCSQRRTPFVDIKVSLDGINGLPSMETEHRGLLCSDDVERIVSHVSNDTLEPVSQNLLLWNWVAAALINLDNITVLLPDASYSTPGTFQSFIMQCNGSGRVLSGHCRENFEFNFHEFDISVGQCAYVTDMSLPYGHYSWESFVKGVHQLFLIDKITLRYGGKVEDETLASRKINDIKKLIVDSWGTLRSSIRISIADSRVHEFSYGVVNSMLLSPSLVVKIKRRGDNAKLVPSKRISSATLNTRSPAFWTSCCFMIEDEHSYSNSRDKESPYFAEVLLYDEGGPERRLVGWCTLSMNSNSGDNWIAHTVRDARDVEIGTISLKHEIMAPVLAVYVSELRGIDFEALSGDDVRNVKGTVHVVVSADNSNVSASGLKMNAEDVLSYSTTSRSIASEVYFKEYLYFPYCIGEALPLSVDLKLEEGGYRELSIASAPVLFKGDTYCGTLQMRDSKRGSFGELLIEMRVLTHHDLSPSLKQEHYRHMPNENQSIYSPMSSSLTSEFTSTLRKREHNSIRRRAFSNCEFGIKKLPQWADDKDSSADGQTDLVLLSSEADLLDSLPVRTVTKELSLHAHVVHVQFAITELVSSLRILRNISPQFLKKCPPQPALNGDDIDSQSCSKNIMSCRTDSTIKHSGKLTHRCGDYNSRAVTSAILKRHTNLTLMLANTSPTTPVSKFWQIFSGISSCSGDGVTNIDKAAAREIQKLMIQVFKDYTFALEGWGLLVVPYWLGIPRIGSIVSRSGKRYIPILSPVVVGSRVYIDTPGWIQRIDGEITNLPMTGIRTAKSDTSNTSSKFLSFLTSDASTVYVCWDQRCPQVPKWLDKRGFALTNYEIQTSTTTMSVYAKQVSTASRIYLGGCGCSPMQADNYFVLVSRQFSPSFRKAVSPGGAPRFCLPRGLQHTLPEDGALSVDLSTFTWQLYRETPVGTDAVTAPSRCSYSDDATAPASEYTHSTHFVPTYSLLLKTRYVWSAVVSTSRIRVSIGLQGQHYSDVIFRIGKFDVKFDWKHFVEEVFGLLPRFDSLNCTCCFEIDAKLSRSQSVSASSQHQSNLDYVLEPIVCRMKISKAAGFAQLSFSAGTQKHIVINISPPMIFSIVRTCDEILGAIKTINSDQSEMNILRTDDKESDDVVISGVIFENNLGQDIFLKLTNTASLDIDFLLNPSGNVEDNEDDVNTFSCLVSTDALTKVHLPEPTSWNTNPAESLSIDLHTDGWTDIRDIHVDCFDRVRTYDIQPLSYTDDTSHVAHGDDHIPSCDNNYESKTLDWEDSSQDFLDYAREFDLQADIVRRVFDRSMSGVSDNPYAVRVSSRVIRSDVTESSNFVEKDLVDAGYPFMANAGNDSHGSEGCVKWVLYISFSTNTEFVNKSCGTVDLTVVYNDENEVLEVEDGESVPLPLGTLLSSSFTMQKVWGCDMYMPDAVDVALSKHSLNKRVPPKLRISREHEVESIWVYHASQKSDVRSHEHELCSNKTWSPQGNNRNTFSRSDQSLSFGSMSELGNAVESEDENEPAHWMVTLFPSITLSNALPCSLELEITLPPDPSTENENAYVSSRSNAARDLFFLPDEFYTHRKGTFVFEDTSDRTDGWIPFSDSDHMVVKSYIEAGRQWSLPCSLSNRSIYFRVRFPGTDLWSKAHGMSYALYNQRTLYRKHNPESIQWDYERCQDLSLKRAPPVQFKRQWNTNREIVFFAEYWIVNKSGIAMFYETGLAKSHQDMPLISTEMDSEEQKKRSPTQHVDSMPVSAYHSLPFMQLEYSDDVHRMFMGTNAVPILMSCPDRRLRVMPYSMATEIGHRNFYVYDIQCLSNKEYTTVSTLDTNIRVYSDEDWIITELPSSVASSLKTLQSVYIQPPNSDRYSDPDLREFIRFKVLADSFVYVCFDARCRKLPSWVVELGFLSTGERLRTDNSDTVYQVYRKYFRGFDWVSLGGNRMRASSDSVGKGKTVLMYLVFVVETPINYREPTVVGVKVRRNKCIGSQSVPYKLKPMFKPGDNLYVDDTATLSLLPKLLSNIPLIAVQTATSDRYIYSSNFVDIQLQHPSRVFLCVDTSIESYAIPKWIFSSGFKKSGMFLYAGQTVYNLFHRPYGVEVCTLGGMACRSRLQNNYFVIIVDEEALTRELSHYPINTLPTAGNWENRGSVTRVSPKQNNLDDIGGLLKAANIVEKSVYSFWDCSHGSISTQKPLFDEQGRHWSKFFDVAAGNKGELQTSCATFAVTIHNLPGMFHRTKVVTILPRFIIVNRLCRNLILFPEVAMKGACINGRKNRPLGTLSTAGSASVIYSFYDVNRENKEWKKRVLRVQIDTGAPNSRLFSERFVSIPISMDDVGETFIWLPVRQTPDEHEVIDDVSKQQALHAAGDSLIISASVMLEGTTVVLTLNDVSQSPPYRLENRTSTVSVLFRQLNLSTWARLPPRSWRSYLWDDPYGEKSIELCVEGTDVTSRPYLLDEIGPVDNFRWSSTFFPSILVPKLHGEGYLKRASQSYTEGMIGGHIYADGTTRVLVLFEVNMSPSLPKSLSFVQNHHSPLRTTRSPATLLCGHDVRIPTLTSQQLLLRSLAVSLLSPGFCLNLISDAQRDFLEELLCMNIEGIACAYNGQSPEFECSVFHIQVDDMRTSARFPVVFVPSDSGLNSHLSEDGAARPQFRIKCNWNYSSDSNVTHICNLEFVLEEVSLKVDMDMVMECVSLIGHIIQELTRHDSFLYKIVQPDNAALAAAIEKLSFTISSDVIRTANITSRRPVYVELFHHSSIVVNLEVYVGRHFLNIDLSAMSESVAVGFAALGSPVLSFISGVIGTIAHVSPSFKFNELLVSNFFGVPEKFMKTMYVSFAHQILAQSYKLFGSMEVLGDPLSLFDNLGTGVADFFLKTRSEMIGDAKTRGEGVRRLAQAVVGSAFGSAAKISGSLEEIVRHAAGLDDGTEGITGFDQRHLHTVSLSGGIRYGGDVFVNSVVNGFSGLVEGPVSGFTRDGVPGAISGTIKGIVGLVAAPVTGALGAVSVVTESVKQSTQFRSTGRPIGRRRRTRRKAYRRQYITSSRYAHDEFEDSTSSFRKLEANDWSDGLPRRYTFVYSDENG